MNRDMSGSKNFPKNKKGVLVKDCKVDILGTKYKILYRKPNELEEMTDDLGGMCDGEKKVIIINADIAEIHDVVYTVSLRHEIIHAYLFESGLSTNWVHPEMGHDETYVDWIAIQFPKMLKTFKELDCL